jgi:hypothetical protein
MARSSKATGTKLKLGLVGAWQDGQLRDASDVAARATATNFAPRLGTEAARRGALDIVGWRGLGTDGGGQEAVLRPVAASLTAPVDLGACGCQRSLGSAQWRP